MDKPHLWAIVILVLTLSLSLAVLFRPWDIDPADREYLLAVSWQPAFCESKPRRTECQTQRPDRFDAANFALHGLWPQPPGNIYCGVDAGEKAKDRRGRWRDLDLPVLPNPLVAEIQTKMPGAASDLHRHQWVKHGTCMNGQSAEDYFKISMRLLDQLNAAAPLALFVARRGQLVTRQQISEAFDNAFGEGAGRRISLKCFRDDDRLLIQEVRIALRGNLANETPPLRTLILAAPPRKGGCGGGIVDLTGLQ